VAHTISATRAKRKLHFQFFISAETFQGNLICFFAAGQQYAVRENAVECIDCWLIDTANAKLMPAQMRKLAKLCVAFCRLCG